MAFTPVDIFLKETCKKIGDHDYRFYNLLIGPLRRGFNDLHLWVMPTMKTVRLELNSMRALEWPDDCVLPVLVGLYRGGKLVTLSVDGRIQDTQLHTGKLLEAERQIDGIVRGEIDTELDYPFFPSNGFGELYGIGQGFNDAGYVAHKKDLRISIINGSILPGDDYLMSYKSDGISNGIEAIPVEAEIALQAFVLSDFLQIKNPNLSMALRQTYKEEFIKLRKFYQSMTEDEWLDSFLGHVKSSVK